MTPLSALRASLHGYDITIVEEVETQVATGTFAARTARDLARLASLSRSWEAFDRVYRTLDSTEESALLRRCLWPALDGTTLKTLSGEATHGIAFTLEGKFVGIWPGNEWTQRKQSWSLAL